MVLSRSEGAPEDERHILLMDRGSLPSPCSNAYSGEISRSRLRGGRMVRHAMGGV